ncbi:MAG: TylF/MycF/NovP-related O-methyltransferase, partial [Nitriliruptoraceae bacterium]
CDTFAGHAAVDADLDGEHAQEDKFADVSADEVRDYLDGESVEVVAGDIMETADRIPGGAIGFLHLDVDVYPPTKFCLDHFSSQMPVGSMIVVDDYGFVTCAGAKQAVDEFIDDHPNWRRLHLITGQALLVHTGASS